MPHFVEGVVTEVLEERAGLQKVGVERDDQGAGGLAYVLTQLIGPVEVGDRVVLNVTAVDLDLGTGGWHFVHWNLSRHEYQQIGPGHVLKLRYTSLQTDTGVVEETETFEAPESLMGTPVVGCLLLSQVAAVAVAFKSVNETARLALVLHDQNAVPLVLSDLAYELQAANLVDATVTTGQAFGGDYEAVNLMSGYGIAKQLANADAIIVANGHGSVGTGTRLGFSALPLAAALDDAYFYGGRPILSVRWSGADQRKRHQGLSHHSQTVMDRTDTLTIAVPVGSPITHDRHSIEQVDVPDIPELLERWKLSVTTMGRGPDKDPTFFTYAAAAGIVAARATTTGA
jgi:hypothetical protein